MNRQSDQELLDEYARRGSEAAFNELVRRHTDLVYSTAVRLVIDPHLAQDVSQRVFIALARNARKLAGRPAIGGWLHRTTHNFSVMTIRTEERRRVREQKAAPMLAEPPDANAVWDCIAPYLDDALGSLNDADRDVMVLRFFQRKTAREIGQCLGLNEEAAQKRIARALERLRDAFRSRGIALPPLAIGGAISTEAVHAAPVGLAATLATHALAGAAVQVPLAAGVAKGIHVVAQLKAHPIAAVATLVACLSLGTGGFVAGKAAARKHHAAAAWQEALLGPGPDRPATEGSTAVIDPVVEPAITVSRGPSIAEIVARAAEHFRREADPDGWARGFVELEKLRPEEIEEALRHVELLRGEPKVFEGMVPFMTGIWARINPHAALNYAFVHLDNRARALAFERAIAAWASKDPDGSWAWYLETSDSGEAPIRDDSWGYVPRRIFEGWVRNDTGGAFNELVRLGLTHERSALSGISAAVKDANVRGAILDELARMADGGRKYRVAEELVEEWSLVEPRAAIEWACSLAFENPASRLRVMTEALEQWWMLDPHAALTWALTHAPAEMYSYVREIIEEN